MKALRRMHIGPAAMALLLGLVSLPGAAQKEEATAGMKDWFRGSLDVGLDLQRTDDDSDVELDQYLRFDITPPQQERLRVRGALWTIEDLDGKESATSTLRNLNDAAGSDVQARLLRLYFEADNLWGDSTLRVGRQRILESAANNRIDGLYFKQRHAAWNWYAFLGPRASVYVDAHNDLVLGGGLSLQATQKTRVALDLFYGEENRSGGDEVRPGPLAQLFRAPFPRRVKRQIDSRQATLTVTHQITPRNHLFSRFTWYEDDSDEFEVSATGAFSSRDIIYDLSYRRRLNLLTDRTNDLTGFYRILGGLDEFDDFQAALHIPMGERYALALEGQVHETEGDDLGNRDYTRFGVVLSGSELPGGMDAEIALEKWDVSGGEGTWTVTGEVSKAWERLEVTAGADFERYQDRILSYRSEALGISRILNNLNPVLFPRYNPLVSFFDVRTVELHENIYSLYLKSDYDLAKDQTLWAELSFEEDDSRDAPYWRLQARYSIDF